MLVQRLPQGGTLQLSWGLGSQLKEKLVERFSGSEREEVTTSPYTRKTAVLELFLRISMDFRVFPSQGQ